MAIKVISDIHGEYSALSDQLEPGDTAVLLGDYLNLLDFHDLGGILSQVYTKEEIRWALSELAHGRKHLARRSIREIAGDRPEKSRRVHELVVESYSAFFDSIPCQCLLIYGNTDDPSVMREVSDGRIEVLETSVVEVEGQRFGFVSGSPQGPWTIGLPGEKHPDEYRRMVESLGPVDVLCTHCPPAVPELTWDWLADRDEVGSDALVEYLDEYGPSRHYFGHVHNPRSETAVRGRTRLINAGFFRRRRTALVHEQ